MHDSIYMLAAIASMFVATFIVRVLPFVALRKLRDNRYINDIGRNLPPTIMLLLVIYCMKDVNFSRAPFGGPELVSIGLVVIMHLWKRNALLSIGAGTTLFIILTRTIDV